MKGIVEGKMKIKSKFYLTVVAVMVSVALLLVQSADTVATAGGPVEATGKGIEMSAQATAGDVPPIEMIPHKSKEELKKKLSRDFKISGPMGINLHSNKTLSEIKISVKNRSKLSKVRKRKELDDFRSDYFYVSQGKSFLKKYSGMLGIKNLEKNIKIRGVAKSKRLGNSSISLYIYLSDYLIENAYINIRFGPDDSIVGATFKLPQITPVMLKAVKTAKAKMLPIDELKKIAGNKFIKAGLKSGMLNKDYVSSELQPWYRDEIVPFTEGVYIVDRAPYLVRDMYWTLPTPPSASRGYHTTYRVRTSVFSGDPVEILMAPSGDED